MSNASLIGSRLPILLALTDGWNGVGSLGPDNKRNGLFFSVLTTYPEDLPPPYLFPTNEGNVMLEWDIGGNPTLEVLRDEQKAIFHRVTRDGSFEALFPLDTVEAIRSLFVFLKGACSTGQYSLDPEPTPPQLNRGDYVQATVPIPGLDQITPYPIEAIWPASGKVIPDNGPDSLTFWGVDGYYDSTLFRRINFPPANPCPASI